jgi:hypothetical protein
MGHKILIALLLIFGLFASLVGCIGGKPSGEEEQAKSLESLSKEWKWYENKEWGYKIKYPSDWGIYEIKEKTKVILVHLLLFLLEEAKKKE